MKKLKIRKKVTVSALALSVTWPQDPATRVVRPWVAPLAAAREWTAATHDA